MQTTTLRGLGADRLIVLPDSSSDSSSLGDVSLRDASDVAPLAATPAMKSILLPPSMGFDTSETLSPSMVTTLASMHFTFGVRYVPLSGGAGGISSVELQAFLSNKIALMLVQFARTNGTAAEGTADGADAASYALRLGFPPSACLWCDLYQVQSSAAAIAYANAWYNGAVSAGFYGSALGIYFEPGVPLTGEERYQKLAFARYWQPGAIAPEVASRGSQMRQAYPGNAVVAPGIVIDYDFASSDFHSSRVMAAVAA